jgi:outer membrane murein-binding lipoprotein Lpp
MKVIFVLLIIAIAITFLSGCNNNSTQRSEFWNKKIDEASDSALYESAQALRFSLAETTNYATTDSVKQHLKRASYWLNKLIIAADSLGYHRKKTK